MIGKYVTRRQTFFSLCLLISHADTPQGMVCTEKKRNNEDALLNLITIIVGPRNGGNQRITLFLNEMDYQHSFIDDFLFVIELGRKVGVRRVFYCLSVTH